MEQVVRTLQPASTSSTSIQEEMSTKRKYNKNFTHEGEISEADTDSALDENAEDELNSESSSA